MTTAMSKEDWQDAWNLNHGDATLSKLNKRAVGAIQMSASHGLGPLVCRATSGTTGSKPTFAAPPPNDLCGLFLLQLK